MFPHFASWQSVAERGRPGRSNQGNHHGMNGLIGNFPSFHDSRLDNVKCWLLGVRSLTNRPYLVISSRKTKGSVIPHTERTCLSEELANVSQVRTNANIQTTPVDWAVRKGRGASPSWAPRQSFSMSYMSNH